MGKHFGLEITDERFSYARHTQRIAAEAALDGVYVLWTSVAAETLIQETLCARIRVWR